jgi:ferric-dicitrate binding protein FerR (iron transport regulator)
MPDRPAFPPELRDALAGEPAADRAEIERVWALLGTAAPPAAPPPAGAWDRLAARLTEAPARSPAPDRPASPSRRRLRLAVGVFAASALAVALVAVALVGLAAWWGRPVTVSAPPGALVRVALPDGSTAELNSGTVLTYRRGFDRLPFVPAARRAVQLDGEAFFAVEPGARPFVVETFNAEVTVLGTRFNVRARRGDGDDATRVAVAEGRVRVAGGGRAVVLAAGEGSTVTVERPAPSAPEAVPAGAAEAWRQGGFAVRDLPLAAVLAEVGRHWDVRVALRGNPPTDGRVTLYLAAPSGPEDVLRDLAGARGLRYRPTSDGFDVYPAGR